MYVTMYYPIFDFSPTTVRICFKFCVDVPWVDPYLICENRDAPPFFMELWVILCYFWPILKKTSIKLSVYGTVYGDMHFKDLLGLIARVGYCIPVQDFCPVLHGLRC